MHITAVQDFIDLLRGKRKPILWWLVFQYKLNKKVQEIRKSGKKVKVAFLHMYITSCQHIPIFERMLEDEHFDPYFIVNPDVMRDKQNFDFQYNRTLTQLREKYGEDRVLEGYDYETNTYKDFTNEFDIMTTSNPYEKMAHEYFRVSYWANKYIPIFYISYFYMGRCWVTINNLKAPTYDYLWKFFAENKYVVKLARKYQTLKGLNIEVAGYPKLDKMAQVQTKEKDYKSIIIAPHHLIGNSDTDIGCFLQYADLLLELPKKYPDIYFVFRPHPMLETALRDNGFWSEEKTSEYYRKMSEYENVEMSLEGDYLDVFANSDALIHDCGSYAAEYLYTGKPCAYMLRESVNQKKTHTKFGMKCINSHYLIKNEADFIDFIENVVIKGIDKKKEERNKFAKNEVMFNYPNATEYIFNYLKKKLIIGDNND